VEGPDGFAGSWTAGKYMCPGAGTETMRMVDCDAGPAKKGKTVRSKEHEGEDQRARLQTLLDHRAGGWGGGAEAAWRRARIPTTEEEANDGGLFTRGAGGGGAQRRSMVCQALGFADGGTSKVACAYQTKYGNCEENKIGQGPIWLSHVNCFGFERDLDGCSHLPWRVAPCFHSEDIGVCCKGLRSPTGPPTYKVPKVGVISWGNLGSAKGLEAPPGGGPPLYAEYVFYIAVKDVFVWTRKARQFLNLCSNFMADGATRPSGYCVEHRACSPLCATKM
jgi:hypothetical protein